MFADRTQICGLRALLRKTDIANMKF